MPQTRINYGQIVSGIITPEMYGATGGADDTIAVQAAFDAGTNVKFTQSYNVSQVILRKNNQTVDFNGYQLTGISTVAKNSILLITASFCEYYNVHVEGTPLINDNYYCAVQWYNAGGASQYNNIYGLFIAYIRRAFIYGNNWTVPPVGGAHSENSVYNFHVYGVELCFVANAPVATLSMYNPTFFFYPNGWDVSSVFNWFNARALVNEGVVLSILGGELQASQTNGADTQPPYCVDMLNTRFFGTRVEAAKPIRITGNNVKFIGCEIQNLKGNSESAFVDASAVTGTLSFDDCNIYRTNTVGGANTRFISSGGNLNVIFNGGTLYDVPVWPIVSFPYPGTYNHLLFKSLAADTGTFVLNSSNENMLDIKGVDILGYNAATGWFTTTSGGGTHTFTVDTTLTPPYGNVNRSFKLLADAVGGSVICNTIDVTSGATVISSGIRIKPGLKYKVGLHSLMTPYTTTNALLNINFYDVAGAGVSTVAVIPYAQFAEGLSAWFYSDAVFTVPAGTDYMGISIVCAYSGGVAQFNFADLILQQAS